MKTLRVLGWTIACLAAGGVAPAAGMAAEAAAPKKAAVESCIACHRDPDFLVTNRKLYNYYRDWERSIHHEEGVTCSDCHGGDPDAASREAAHEGMLGESNAKSSVNFANVPDTCGTCHDEVEAAYRTSKHFEHLVKHAEKGDGESQQGPSCITCHNSMNTLTLDVTTVEATCSECHNDETGNHPDIPDQARVALNRFLSIDRFHRYVAVRLDPKEARGYLATIDARREELSVLWHTFDLERIEAATRGILDDLRTKRDEIRARAKGGAERGDGSATATP